MSILRSALAILVSAVIFYLGFKTGGRSSDELNANNLAHCPSAPKTKRSNDIVTAQDVPHDNKPCPADFQAVCPTFQSNNFAKLHLGKATAPETIFPHLKHPSTPAKWNWYLSHSQKWEPNKPADNDHCEQMYLTRTGNYSIISI